MQKNENHMNQRLARSFFGRESCVRFEHNGLGTWMNVGRKNAQGWEWNKAKLSAVEVGDILCVLAGKASEVSYYHSFEKNGVKKSTRISVNRAPDSDSVFFRIEDHAKPLNPGEQQVLKAFLGRVLSEGCLDAWKPAVQAEAV